ncbi:MAG TPA: SurA N-terminal domain-containing protein [Chthoniobacterales bacterium]
MFTLMRTHQRKLWLAVTVLLIVSFISFYSVTDRQHHMGNGAIARVYGKDLTTADFQREARKFQLTLALGLTDYASALGATGSEESYADFVINKMIIDHEGRALGIQPGDAEVKNAIVALPVFQTGGQFDPQKYRQLVTTSLAPQGFTELEIQELVRSSLILKRIKQTLDAVPAVTEAEVAHIARVFQPVTGLAITFDRATFAAQAKPTEEQIADAFKAGESRFVKPELRTVRYVTFPLPADSQKLEGKARIEAQQKVADASDTFATKAASEGFDKAAREAGLKVETTLPFDSRGQISGLEGLASLGNMSVMGPVAALAPVSFTLTKESPVTGVVQSGDQFLVADLAEVTPSRPMTLEEARPEIVTELTDAAAGTALAKAATDALAKLRAAAKDGQPIAAAAAAAGLKTQPFTNLVLADEAAPADQRRFAEAALVVNENEVSGFRSEPTGGYAVWLEKRGPSDEKTTAAKRAELDAGILAQRQNVLWAEWIRSAQKQAGAPFFTPREG